jgi:hypothetical protein
VFSPPDQPRRSIELEIGRPSALDGGQFARLPSPKTRLRHVVIKEEASISPSSTEMDCYQAIERAQHRHSGRSLSTAEVQRVFS